MNIIENESGLQDQPPAVEARPQDALSVLLARLRMANATQNPESDEAVVEPPWQRTVTARIFYWNLYGLPWCQCIGEPTDDDLRDESYLPRWEAKYREAESVSIPFIDTSSNEVIKKHWAAALSSCPNRWLFQEANMVFYIRVGAAVVPVTTGSDSELTGWYPILHHYAVNGQLKELRVYLDIRRIWWLFMKLYFLGCLVCLVVISPLRASHSIAKPGD